MRFFFSNEILLGDRLESWWTQQYNAVLSAVAYSAYSTMLQLITMCLNIWSNVILSCICSSCFKL